MSINESIAAVFEAFKMTVFLRQTQAARRTSGLCHACCLSRVLALDAGVPWWKEEADGLTDGVGTVRSLPTAFGQAGA